MDSLEDMNKKKEVIVDTNIDTNIDFMERGLENETNLSDENNYKSIYKRGQSHYNNEQVPMINKQPNSNYTNSYKEGSDKKGSYKKDSDKKDSDKKDSDKKDSDTKSRWYDFLFYKETPYFLLGGICCIAFGFYFL